MRKLQLRGFKFTEATMNINQDPKAPMLYTTLQNPGPLAKHITWQENEHFTFYCLQRMDCGRMTENALALISLCATTLPMHPTANLGLRCDTRQNQYVDSCQKRFSAAVIFFRDVAC